MESTSSRPAHSREWSITYKQLGLIIGAFVLGVIAALLFSNARTAGSTTFSTTQLIGFILTVILSGASIVLAISAIALGKTSEQAVIQRSDESIRLQNEVFIRTTEALQRIEASTGVTEKRLEDIISGRVGDISHQIAEIATEGKRGGPKSFAEIEEQIRESIMQTLQAEGRITDRQSERERMMESRQRRAESEQKYQEQHQQLMNCLCNRDDLKVQKAVHGNISASGKDLFDGLFTGQDYVLGASTFRDGTNSRSISAFLSSAAVEISKGTVNIVLAILFSEGQQGLIPEVEQYLANLKDEIRNRLLAVAIKPERSEQEIAKIEFSNNRIQRTGKTPDVSPSADS